MNRKAKAWIKFVSSVLGSGAAGYGAGLVGGSKAAWISGLVAACTAAQAHFQKSPLSEEREVDRGPRE